MRLAFVVVLLLAPAVARAQSGPPITGRDYGIDLYNAAAIGSVRIVGMGGTALATEEGSPGVLVNPASAAVRRTTSHGSWDWDYHLDGLSAAFASDFDNNGVRSKPGTGTAVETAGIAGMLDGWGLAIVETGISDAISGSSGDTLTAKTVETKVALAHELFDRAWTVGVALRLAAFDVDRGAERLFGILGTGLEAGALWRPREESWRIGASASLPVSGRDVQTESCDPSACMGYILPERVEVPWQVAIGVAWRRAATPWNTAIAPDFRDERALLVAADLVLAGAVRGAYNLEGFGAQELLASGRHLSPSLRVGAEYEAVPGVLRLRAGSYWEPGRVSGVGGRVHGTVGVEMAVFQLCAWRWVFRLRVAITGDVAARYGNAGLSIGFWH